MSVTLSGAWLVALVLVPLLKPVVGVQPALERKFSKSECEGRAATWKLRNRVGRKTIRSLMMKMWAAS